MKLTPLDIAGAALLDGEPFADARGSFTRLVDAAVLAAAGTPLVVDQASVSHNVAAGTLRGMHWQAAPHDETKLVQVVAGAIHDVVLDLRPGPGYGRWVAVELTADDTRTLRVPPGCAHGFQTLEPATAVHYLIAGDHVPSAARGVRWDDPAFGIRWPEAPAAGRVMSERGRGLAARHAGVTRVLLTGARGFLGTPVTARLLAAGFDVTATTSTAPPAAGATDVDWHQADLRDGEACARVARRARADILVHLAWDVSGPDYPTSPANATWAAAGARLVRAALEAGATRVVGVGTCAEYDPTAPAPFDERRTPVAPPTPYARAKAALHADLATQADAAGASAAWLRPFFLFGPGEQASRLVPALAAAALAGRPATVNHGDLRRDYLHVEDAAGAISAAVASPVTGPVNICAGTAVRLGDLARAVCDAAGRPDLLDDRAGAGSGLPAEVRGSPARLRDELDVPAPPPLAQRVAAAVEHWRRSPPA